MSRSVMWSYDNVLHLIELYRSNPILWDTNHEDFKDLKKKIEATEEIARSLNVTRYDVESKIHTLRSQFARERKRIANTRDDKTDKQKVWLFYEPMQFLLRENSSGTSDKTDENSQSESDMGSVYFDLEVPSPMVIKDEKDDGSEMDFVESKAKDNDKDEIEEYTYYLDEEDENQDQPEDGAYLEQRNNDPFGISNTDLKREGDVQSGRGKKSAIWSYNKVMHLIKLFRSKTLLWNFTTADYRYRAKRVEACKEIAQVLNVRRRDVESKIHVLRTQYVKERKRIAERIKNGVPISEVTKWAYYEPLDFLADVITRFRFPSMGKNDNTKDNTDLEKSISETTTHDTSFPSKRRKAEDFYKNSKETEKVSGSGRIPEVCSRSRRETDDEFSDCDDRKVVKRKKTEMDSFDIYGAYVASELRSGNNEYAQTQAKYHINNILYQMKMGHYNKGRNVKNNDTIIL